MDHNELMISIKILEDKISHQTALIDRQLETTQKLTERYEVAMLVLNTIGKSLTFFTILLVLIRTIINFNFNKR